jgi:hypothetical protein
MQQSHDYMLNILHPWTQGAMEYGPSFGTQASGIVAFKSQLPPQSRTRPNLYT